MVELYGRTLTRREVAEHTGMLAQVAGVRLVTLGDGIERGVRVLEFRTGGGLRFTVMVDRGFDVAECDYKGQAIGWHSPAGFRHPALHEYEGEGGLAFVRSFSGLLATCGLDHTMGPAEVPADNYNYPGRKTRAAFAARAGEPDPGAARGLRRALGGGPLRALGRGGGAAVGDVRRGSLPLPADRGGGGRQGDPGQRPGGEPRLLPHAAHVLLPRQRRLAAARGRRALSRADPRGALGRRTRRAIGRRGSGIGRWRRRGRGFASRSGSTTSPPTRAASARRRWSTTGWGSGSRW